MLVEKADLNREFWKLVHGGESPFPDLVGYPIETFIERDKSYRPRHQKG